MKKVKVEVGVFVREFITFTVSVPDDMPEDDIERACCQAYRNEQLTLHEESEAWEQDYDAGVDLGGATVISSNTKEDRDYFYDAVDGKFIAC